MEESTLALMPGTEKLSIERVTFPKLALDVMMPRLTGFETVVRLREEPKTAGIPVVMVTGRAQAADLARGEEVGVEAYLTKPFEPAELIEVVTRLAKERRAAR